MFALSIENKHEFLKVKQTNLNACRKSNEETSRGCQHLIKDKDKAFKTQGEVWHSTRHNCHITLVTKTMYNETQWTGHNSECMTVQTHEQLPYTLLRVGKGAWLFLSLFLSFCLPAQVFNIMWSGQVEKSEGRWRISQWGIDQREKERWWRLFGGEGLVSFCFPPFTFTWPSFSHAWLSLHPLYWWPLVRLYEEIEKVKK